VPVLVAFSFGSFDISFDLCLKSLGEHSARSLVGDFVQIKGEFFAGLLIVVYAPHRCILPADVGASAPSIYFPKGRYTASLKKSSIHNFRAYLPYRVAHGVRDGG
jgi:hypothetical protein